MRVSAVDRDFAGEIEEGTDRPGMAPPVILTSNDFHQSLRFDSQKTDIQIDCYPTADHHVLDLNSHKLEAYSRLRCFRHFVESLQFTSHTQPQSSAPGCDWRLGRNHAAI